MKLICGNSNRPLAEAIAAHMRVPLAECNVRRFADEEGNRPIGAACLRLGFRGKTRA